MNWLPVTSFAMTYRDFSRGLHQLTRLATFAGLSISGVWGAWAWYWDQPDPLFRVIAPNSHPVVRAALVEVPEPPRYRNAVQVERVERFHVVEPPRSIETPRPHVMPRYAQLPNLSPHAPPVSSQYRRDIDAACRSCVSLHCSRLYHCGER
jgi:hypothetical protein